MLITALVKIVGLMDATFYVTYHEDVCHDMSYITAYSKISLLPLYTHAVNIKYYLLYTSSITLMYVISIHDGVLY